MIIPEWLFKESIEKNFEKVYNPNTLKRIAMENIKLADKQLNKELAKKMINPYYFTDRNLKVGFKINLDTHHNNHAISKVTIISNFPEFGIEVRYMKKIIQERSVICARIKNQYKFKYHTVFSATFDKQDEDNHVLDETEKFIILNIQFNRK